MSIATHAAHDDLSRQKSAQIRGKSALIDTFCRRNCKEFNNLGENMQTHPPFGARQTVIPGKSVPFESNNSDTQNHAGML